MPRTARASVGGICYHVINRGNGRGEVFHDDTDFGYFRGLLARACERLDMVILAYCLMPNHFHLVLKPGGDGDLGRWMQWLLTSHVRSYHKRYGTSGHVWQGRFKAFPIQQDEHLLTVLRYVERNPLRSRLVRSARKWRWSSLCEWAKGKGDGVGCGWPVRRPGDWEEWVNEAQSARELEQLRASVNRGKPFGSDHWVKTTAKRLGLEASLRQRGRPRKQEKK